MNKILFGLILIAVLAMIFGSTGCRTPQKAASRLVYRGMDKDAKTVYNICSDIAPPVESVRDSFVYIQGETIYKKGEPYYVTIDCDSVVLANEINNSNKINQLRNNSVRVGLANKIRIPCPPCDSVRIDTVKRLREEIQVNKSKEYALRDENKELTEANIKLKQTNKWLWWAVITLAVYTILRWVLRAYKINLP